MQNTPGNSNNEATATTNGVGLQVDQINVVGVATFPSNITFTNVSLDQIKVGAAATFSNINLTNVAPHGGNFKVAGISTFTGNVFANGNVTLGNASSDTITATGRFNTSLVPSTDNARDLGTSGLEWKDLFLDGTAHIDTLDVDGNAEVIGNLTVTGNSVFNGNVDLGNATGDTISATGRFDTHLVPSTDDERDLGTSTLQWRNIYSDGTINADVLDVDNTADFGNSVTIAGLLDANGGAHIDNLRLGIDADNDITTSSGNLTLDSAGGTVRVNDNLTVDGTITGNGYGLTSLNAANIASGTINDARLPGTITSNITGNAASSDTVDVADQTSTSADRFLTFTNSDGSARTIAVDDNLKYRPNTNTLTAGTFSGSGSGLTSLNASQISSGTINDARLPGTISSDITGTATQANNINIDETNSNTDFQVTFSAQNSGGYERQKIDTDNSHFVYNPSTNLLKGLNINCNSSSTLRGDGSNITSLNASQLSSGTVPLARLGSGTKNSTTFLAGDNTFKTVVVAINNLTNAGNNRVITSSGGSDANSEVNLTFDNSNLHVHGTSRNILSDGNIIAFNTSDITFKDNVQPITNAVEKVLSISGNTFTWNDKAPESLVQIVGKEDTGVIAQEVDELGLPGVVQTKDDGTKGVRYEKLVPLLIEAIKELKAEIDELKK